VSASGGQRGVRWLGRQAERLFSDGWLFCVCSLHMPSWYESSQFEGLVVRHFCVLIYCISSL
jgi:hypothetical protein